MFFTIKFTLATLFTFVITFFIFYQTASHSVSGGDSGEVMIAANELVVAHPPGYPLFVLLYNALARMLSTSSSAVAPLFDKKYDQSMAVARRYNLISCFLSALGASFTTGAAFLWTNGDAAASISTSLIIFLSSTIWTYSIQTEVFALHNFFVALLLFILVWYEQRPSVLRAGVGAFFCGLALTNQHTSVLMVVPLAAYIALYRQLDSLRAKPILVTLFYTFCFLLGLCPVYAFLVWSARNSKNHSLVAWGDTGTLEGFMHHFLRADYGTLSLGSQESTYLVRATSKTWKLFLTDCFTQLGEGYFVLFPLLGLISLVAKKYLSSSKSSTTKNTKTKQILTSSPSISISIAVILCWISYTTFFHALSNLPIDKPLFLGVQQRFWMHPFMLVAFFSAPGISFLLNNIISTLINSIPILPGVVKTFFHTLIRIALPLIILTTQLLLNYTSHDESNNSYVESFGFAILDSLPQNAILFTKGDLVINSVRFVQSIKKYRQDVAILDQEMMTYPWYISHAAAKFNNKTTNHIIFPGKFYFPGKKEAFDMAMLLNANGIAPSVAKNRYTEAYRRAFFCYGVKEGDVSVARAGMTLRPAGICDEVVRKPLDEPRELKLKDASLYALDLMRSLPLFGTKISVPDAELERMEEKKQRRLNVMIKNGNYSAALTSHYFVNELSLLNKLVHFVLEPEKTSMKMMILLGGGTLVNDEGHQRTTPYDKTSWETVAASDLASAIQKVSFKLHSTAEMQKAKHPELLTSASVSVPNKNNNNNNEKATTTTEEETSTTVFPPESWTFEDLESTCTPCFLNEEAANFAYEQIRLFNRKPSLPCASDTRTVFMCAIYASDKLLDELIRRFPREVTSADYRNKASIVQTLMQFAAQLSNKETYKEMQKMMVSNLKNYVKLAKKEKIDKNEISKLQQAADFFEKQLKQSQ